jgi:hypothetical protein
MVSGETGTLIGAETHWHTAQAISQMGSNPKLPHCNMDDPDAPRGSDME